jgi:CheY-like chemotaxis protein
MAKVLIVDDNPDICFLMKRLLEMNGHDALTAFNGHDAIDCLEEHDPFDILITDIIMPKMDGIELIMAIRPKYPQLKIIAISGGGRIPAEEYLEMARLMKVNHVLTKPITSADLLTAVNDLFK